MLKLGRYVQDIIRIKSSWPKFGSDDIITTSLVVFKMYASRETSSKLIDSFEPML